MKVFKIKIFYICLALIAVLFACYYVYTAFNKPICERQHLDDELKLWGREDAVPNEETARKIADVIVDSHDGFAEDREYIVEINFNEKRYEWQLYYYINPPEGYSVLGGEIKISIRKDCGMITNLAYSK